MPRYPVDNRIKNGQQIPFGGTDSNAKYGRHSGDDSANGVGTPVFAPASGMVTGYTSSPYHGQVVEIQDSRGLFPHIFHLRERVVAPGQKVSEGQLIGYSGSTGLSTGPHVHFGVSKKSVPTTTSFNDFIDPMEYIKSKGEEPMPNDGDIINLKRIETGVPNYQPSGEELRFYKDPANGWKKLAYDLAAGAQVQIDLAKKASGGDAVEKINKIKEIVK